MEKKSGKFKWNEKVDEYFNDLMSEKGYREIPIEEIITDKQVEEEPEK